jgi:hypothetical protein
MSSDPGYQVTPPPPRHPAARDDSSPVMPADLQLRPSIWWTGGQLAFVAIEAVALLTILLVSYVVRPDYTRMLMLHPAGIKMLIVSVLLLIINFVGFLGICLWFNRAMPPGDETKEGRRTVAHWAVALVFLLLFYAPFVFVILVGPAAIAIQENLMR